MSERRRSDLDEDIRARLRAAEAKLERELADAAARLRSGIIEEREKSVMERWNDTEHHRAAEKSFRSYLRSPRAAREIRLAIRALQAKRFRSVSDTKKLGQLREMLLETMK